MLWIVVALSFVRLHPKLVATGEITDVRMWAPNVLPWVMIALAGGVIALMLADPAGRFQMFAVAVVVGIVALAGVVWTRVTGKKEVQ